MAKRVGASDYATLGSASTQNSSRETAEGGRPPHLSTIAKGSTQGTPTLWLYLGLGFAGMQGAAKGLSGAIFSAAAASALWLGLLVPQGPSHAIS